jgi:formylglycine-generating enzyme required for sulfatase activity
MNKYEVTQEEWRAVMGKDPPELQFKGCDKCPVENVSWNDIQEFLKKINKITGNKFRLPTEAEWEYAARGGEKFKFSGSKNLNEVGWYNSNSGNKTHPVGQKNKNGFGLYDMSGNVIEWCKDTWHPDYIGAPNNESEWEMVGISAHVLRGGCFRYTAATSRVSFRNNQGAHIREDVLGFRLAHSL